MGVERRRPFIGSGESDASGEMMEEHSSVGAPLLACTRGLKMTFQKHCLAFPVSSYMGIGYHIQGLTMP